MFYYKSRLAVVKKSLKRLKRKIYFKHIVIATVVLCLVVGLGLGFFLTIDDGRANAFSGLGAGSTEDPYQINTCGMLQEISLAPTSNYILMADINCAATTTWNSGQGFLPISGFAGGSLDGRNHVISNIFIRRDASSLALFENIAASTEVKNFSLNGGSVRNLHTGDATNQKTASLVALNNGTVTNVSSSVSVRGSGVVGGLIAADNGMVDNSSSSGDVVVVGTWNSQAGGLVGQTLYGYRIITNSYSTSNVTATDDGIGWTYSCGGLVGVGSTGLFITNSYATGEVDCEYPSTNGAGGLLGSLELGPTQSAFVQRSFSTGKVYGTGSQYGGLAGKISSSIDLTTNYFDATSSGQTACYSLNPTACNAVNTNGLSPNYFKNNVTNPPLNSSWDFTTTWAVNSLFPLLRSSILTPEAPQNLTAQAYGTKLSVTWNPPLDNGGSAITGYKVQYKLHTDANWVDASSSQIPSTKDIDQLLPATSYDARILAENSKGFGLVTPVITMSTLASGVSPPTGLTASNITRSDFNLSWTAPLNASGEPLTNYKIQYSTTQNEYWNDLNPTNPNLTSRTLSYLSAGTEYKIRMASVTQNQLSAWSSELIFTTDQVPETFTIARTIPRAVSYAPIPGQTIFMPPSTLNYTVTLTYVSAATTDLDAIDFIESYNAQGLGYISISSISVSGGTATDTGSYNLATHDWQGHIAPGQSIEFTVTSDGLSRGGLSTCTTVLSATYLGVNVPIQNKPSDCTETTIAGAQTDLELKIAQTSPTPSKIGDALNYTFTTTNLGNVGINDLESSLNWYVLLPTGYSYQSSSIGQGIYGTVLLTDEQGQFGKFAKYAGQTLVFCNSYEGYNIPLVLPVGGKIEFSISGTVDNTIFTQRSLELKSIVAHDSDIRGYYQEYTTNNDGVDAFDYQTNNIAKYTTVLPEAFVSPSAERLRPRSASTVASAPETKLDDVPTLVENKTLSNKQSGAGVEGLQVNAPRSLVERLAQIIPASAAQVLPYGLILLLLVFAVLYCLDALGQYRQQQEVMLINQRIKKTKQTADDFIKLTTHYLNTPVAALGSALELIENSGQQSPELVNKLKQQCCILSSDVKNLVDTNIQEVQTSSAVKDSLDSATKTLRNRRIWLPIVLVMACLAGSNLLFIKGNVYDASIVKLAVQAVVFVLSCLLIIFGYQYGQRFKKNVVLVRNVRDEETKLLAQKRVFVVVSYQKIHADYKDLLDLSTKLVPSQPTDFFVRGLKQLGALTTSMGSISHFMNTSTDAPLCNISDHITNMVQQYIMAGQQKKIQIVADIQPSLVSKIKKEEVDQLMKSVIDNAIKFTPDGGKIVVSAKRKGKQIILSVSDTGKGIAKDKLPTLLEPFARGTSTEQYDYEGIGLDLYTDKVILSKLGGDVQIKSQEGHGTTVTHTFNIQNDNKALAPVIIVPVTS